MARVKLTAPLRTIQHTAADALSTTRSGTQVVSVRPAGRAVPGDDRL